AVLGERGQFAARCTMGRVELDPVVSSADQQALPAMLEAHFRCSQSVNARRVLESWDMMLPKFVKVMPSDYKRVLQERKTALAKEHAQRNREAVSRG
ncbi:MAG: hypothetical protein KC588_15890, partial [Nitrospira sp.]|nr:hypothetical protein [Nitrospira sp.]